MLQKRTHQATRGTKRTRGFVILVVLAVAVAITAVVAAQLVSGQKAQVTAIRSNEEARARAVAEACLDELTQYAENMIPEPAPAGADFDNLLTGTDHTTGNGSTSGVGADDFLPGITTRRVQIPPSAPANQLHMWELVDVAPGSGGLCAVRFDDNSDDSRPALPGAGAATGAGEGTGVDNPYKDRDLAIYVTVIGLYPVLSGTTDANAYSSAHARVTLRRLIAKSNSFTPLAPALWANTVQLNNNNDICGAGGIEATDLQLANNSCACGATTTTNPCTGAGCPSNGQTCPCPGGCPPASVSTGGATAPPVNVHWGRITGGAGNGFDTQPDFTGMQNLLANEGWGRAPWVDPTQTPATGEGTAGEPSTANNIGQSTAGIGDACSFYATAGGDVFIWDMSDNDPIVTLADLADDGLLNASVSRGASGGVSTPGAANMFDSGGTGTLDGFAGLDCSNVTSDPFPAPCTWGASFLQDPGAGYDPSTASFNCAAGQSPCWKLIARLGDTRGNDADVGVGKANSPESTSNKTSGSVGDADWEPQLSGGTASLPNVKKAYTSTGTSPVYFGGANRLCGDTTACSGCSSSAGADDVLRPKLFWHHPDHWHFKAGSDNAHMPFPSYWVMEGTGPHTAIDTAGSAFTGPWKAAVFAQNKIDGLGGFGSNALCCPTCDCTALYSPFPRINVGFTGCSLGGTIGPTNAIVKSLYDNNNVIGAAGLGTKGTALKSLDLVQLDGLVVGDVRAQTVKLSSSANSCHIGNLIAYGPGTCGTCDTTLPSTPAGSNGALVCFSNNANHIGDIESMASIDDGGNNPDIWGNVIAKGNVCFKNNARIEGTIQAGGSIDFKNNATIVNTTTSSGGTAIAANPALTSFMEATW